MDVNNVMHRKRAEDLGDFEKVSGVEILPRKKTVDFHELAEALCRVRTWFGAGGKARIERRCISLLMSKNL